MAHTVVYRQSAGILVPAMLLAGLLATISVGAGVFTRPDIGGTLFEPALVTIAPRPYSYRAPGDFIRGTAVVDGPLVRVEEPEPLDIMKFQVSAADYGRCVAEGACRKSDPRRPGEGNVPVTGVSFDDANAYAAWLSAKTGETWRLPSVAEWAFAAGSKARDHALDVKTDPRDPAQRWLAYYEREAALAGDALAAPSPLGTFGENEYGVADLSETVWEWTSTCGSRTTLGVTEETKTFLESCGVRLLEGRHRTPMSGFVRDAQGGGCTIGAPPDNLGFRLVRERHWWERVFDQVRQLAGQTQVA